MKKQNNRQNQTKTLKQIRRRNKIVKFKNVINNKKKDA